MNSSPVNLDELLLDFSAHTESETEAEGEKRFRHEFITRNGRSGALTAHDGAEVKFFADRYHHAFHTSDNRARQAHAKGKVAIDRIERIRWIKPIIEGRVAGIECWEIPLKVPEEGLRCFPGKRAYISWEDSYIIWLEPLRAGGFKFHPPTSCPPPKSTVTPIAPGSYGPHQAWNEGRKMPRYLSGERGENHIQSHEAWSICR